MVNGSCSVRPVRRFCSAARCVTRASPRPWTRRVRPTAPVWRRRPRPDRLVALVVVVVVRQCAYDRCTETATEGVVAAGGAEFYGGGDHAVIVALSVGVVRDQREGR